MNCLFNLILLFVSVSASYMTSYTLLSPSPLRLCLAWLIVSIFFFTASQILILGQSGAFKGLFMVWLCWGMSFACISLCFVVYIYSLHALSSKMMGKTPNTVLFYRMGVFVVLVMVLPEAMVLVALSSQPNVYNEVVSLAFLVLPCAMLITLPIFHAEINDLLSFLDQIPAYDLTRADGVLIMHLQTVKTIVMCLIAPLFGVLAEGMGFQFFLLDQDHMPYMSYAVFGKVNHYSRIYFYFLYTFIYLLFPN